MEVMGLGDWVRAFFSRRANPALSHLDEFARTHLGVEGYIEPRTATQPVTLLLVDRDGEHIRGPVREPEDAIAFCERRGLPVYDAAVIGYPRRMRGRSPADDVFDEKFAEIEKQFKESGGPETPDR
jgi:hypothetical protein